MKIVEFPEHNKVFARDQKQYIPLPAYQWPGDSQGRITCCWSLSWRERFKLLFTGRIWHSILTFNSPLQPQLLSVVKPPIKKGT